MRNFDNWLSSFRATIASYDYYVDFAKVFTNAESYRFELNLINSLIGSRNIEQDFVRLLKEYPKVLKCIPILLAKRGYEISATDECGTLIYDFKKANKSIEQYCSFMRKTGLFNLISNHLISNVFDYVTGVEVGLDSNGRKNRGGHLMEDIVERYLIASGLTKDIDYFKEMYISEIEQKWGLDLSCVSNQGKAEKRFDFVVKGEFCVYGVETNFYASGGSKLNETARSYKTIATETKDLKDFHFVWFTDGQGWASAKNNLLETFEVMEHLYNIADLEQGVAFKIFK